MADPDLTGVSDHSLADLMDCGRREGLGRPDWRPEELGAMLRHQLDAKLEFDLSRFESGSLHELAQATARAPGPPLVTFRDLFEHPRPPVELLDLARRFAKASRADEQGPVPDEIATVLYFASIVGATCRCGQRISKLDGQALSYALDWALDQPWLDVSLRGLFLEGRRGIVSRRSEGDG